MDSPTVTYASDRDTLSPPATDHDMALLQHDMHCWDFAKRRYGDIGHVDVAEVFSPPRVALVAERMGFKAGSSLDITGNDECGVPWNFNNKVMRDKAMKKYIEEEPFLLVGSPVCTMWSQMMNINKNKMDPLEYSQRMSEARVHMNFVCKLYMMQHKAGRYFIHEQPQAARSWEEECVQRTMRETNSQRLLIHQCMYGLVSVDTNGKTNPARKATSFMTNCPAMSLTLSTICDKSHQHTVLEGGNRTKASQVYPDMLCNAIVAGMALQKKWDAKGQYLLGTVETS